MLLLAPLLACGTNPSGKHDGGVPSTKHDGGAPDAGSPPEASASVPEVGGDAPPDASLEAAADANAADVNAADAPETAPVHQQALGVAIGSSHACVLRDDHTVKCWGSNVPTVDLPPVRSLAAGGTKTCAILDDGSVRCWLALAPGPTDTFAADLGPGRVASALALNAYAWACALLDDLGVRCWTTGATPSTKTLAAPTTPSLIKQVVMNSPTDTMALYADGTLTDSAPLALTAPHLYGSGAAASLATCRGGAFCWCATLAAGGVLCVGTLPAQTPPRAAALKTVALGDTYSCGLRADGSVSCWGSLPGCTDGSPASSYWCKPGLDADGGRVVALGQPAVALATGTLGTFACAVLADGGVKCWGGAGGEPLMGNSVAFTDTSAGRVYGAWRALDLAAPP